MRFYMMLRAQHYIVIVLALAFLVSHTIAGTQYISGSPDLSAFISGTNEFSPGGDVSIPVVIENTGLNEFKLVQSSLVDREDLPNTAKHLVVTLAAGNAPLTIKSDPQMVGDLPGGSTVTGTFNARINTDASAGTYYLPVNLNYTYLDTAEQYATDTIRYYYKTANATLVLPIRIKPDISIDVLSAEPDHLNVGTEGYINLVIQNTGTENGKNTVVKIIRNGNSPVAPVDNSVFIGEFLKGSVVRCRYKVSVTSGTESAVYPVDVSVTYDNIDGETVTSRSRTVGIPVGGKIDFEVVSSPEEIHPGQKKTILVDFKNTGETKIYSALARISAVDPFTSNDDIAYLGDMDPGQTVRASYEISVDRSATIKEYGLDSEIRYRDEFDTTYLSDIMKVRITVTGQTGIAAVLSSPIMLSVIAAAIIGIAYAVFHFRKKRN
jgi:hypothetical protein